MERKAHLTSKTHDPSRTQIICKVLSKAIGLGPRFARPRPRRSPKLIPSRPKSLQKLSKIDFLGRLRVLGASLGGVGAPWAGLWALLGRPGGVLGLFCGVLGASWGVLGRLGRVPGASWGRLGDVLEASWGRLGASQQTSSKIDPKTSKNQLKIN